MQTRKRIKEKLWIGVCNCKMSVLGSDLVKVFGGEVFHHKE
jgi:hypothetical protein